MWDSIEVAVIMVSSFRTCCVLTCLNAFADIHSFSKYLLSTSSVPGPLLNGGIAQQIKQSACFCWVHILVSLPTKTSSPNSRPLSLNIQKSKNNFGCFNPLYKIFKFCYICYRFNRIKNDR